MGASSSVSLIDGPSTRRAAMGRLVNDTLARHRLVGRYDTDVLDIYYTFDFLDPAECAELIRRVDLNCGRSEVVGMDRSISEFRTSDSGNVDHGDEFIADIEQRICDMMGLNPRQGETMQGQRYRVGQEFQLHCDYFNDSQGAWPTEMRTGGQRTWTAMIYLDTPEQGGTTLFRDAGFAVPPTPGLMVMWNNMRADGSPNPGAIHAGTPVEAGVKHVITKWFREGYWV
jgi:prolyl 4-hydroxylase